MIRRHVSAALLVRDGFTGQPFASGSVFVCRLNGLPVRPLFKPGGYLVLTDLEAGEHTFSLAARGFHTETLALTIAHHRTLEQEVAMRPDSRYAFPPDTARLHLELAEPDGAGEQDTGAAAQNGGAGGQDTGMGGQKGVLAHEEVWVGWPAPVQLRLAQSVEAGEAGHVRLFCSGAPSLLPVPGHFLLLDKKGPEVVRLWELRDGGGGLDGPAAFPHPRGTVLVPAMRFRTDADGQTELAFPRGGAVSLFCRGCLKSVELRSGRLDLRWMPEGAEKPETQKTGTEKSGTEKSGTGKTGTKNMGKKKTEKARTD